MHVGLNLVYLVPGETGGTETYARELIPALKAVDPEVELTAFVSREAAEARDAPWSSLIPSVVLPVGARRRVEWVRGEQFLLPQRGSRARIDVLHSLANTASFWGPFARVVTIHDLIHRRHPEAHFGLRAWGMRVLVPLAARRSHRILVPSAHARDEVVRELRIPFGKIDVVPLGTTLPATQALVPEAEIRQRHDLGSRRIVLTTSAKRSHKNLIRLLEALALIPRERRPLLVLPGYATPHESELKAHAASLGVASDARFLGWVPEDELEALFGVAALFVYPSLEEGFGLPILEAMARNVPVACANGSSLPEVAGEAALLFDPEHPEAIAAAIETLLSNPTEAARIVELGRRRVVEFTWAETARGTLAAYRRALLSASGRATAAAQP